MKRRWVFSVILIILIIGLTACGDNAGSGSDTGAGAGAGPASNLSGAPAEILDKLVEDTKTAIEESGEFMYMSMTLGVTPDVS